MYAYLFICYCKTKRNHKNMFWLTFVALAIRVCRLYHHSNWLLLLPSCYLICLLALILFLLVWSSASQLRPCQGDSQPQQFCQLCPATTAYTLSRKIPQGKSFSVWVLTKACRSFVLYHYYSKLVAWFAVVSTSSFLLFFSFSCDLTCFVRLFYCNCLPSVVILRILFSELK
jgi:hypothetical protein